MQRTRHPQWIKDLALFALATAPDGPPNALKRLGLPPATEQAALTLNETLAEHGIDSGITARQIRDWRRQHYDRWHIINANPQNWRDILEAIDRAYG